MASNYVVRKLIIEDDKVMTIKFTIVHKLPPIVLMHKAEKGNTIGISRLTESCFEDSPPKFTQKGFAKKAVYYQTLKMVDKKAFIESGQCAVKYLALLPRVIEMESREKDITENKKRKQREL